MTSQFAAMGLLVYGIKNCDTIKKTLQLLEDEGIGYNFIDFKKEMPDKKLIEGFLQKVSLAELINKRGTTYRKLPEDQKRLLESRESALPVIMDNSSLIKRPVIQFPNGELIVGLKKDEMLRLAKAS
jgi:Spx/MgsR family transcriptional regulator